MSLETKKEKIIYQGVVPVVGAILGAVFATWYQATSLDQSQLSEIVELVRAPDLSAEQRIQALEIYERITDRPWGIVRSLLTFAGIAIGALIGAGFFNRLGNRQSD